ncbi:MAG TPA: hypothetical protein VGL81_30010 [Polyangiaceae bacterium]|jgi:hypothetical protein
MSVERRPSFATEFPESPELDALVEAFARGDFARVRAEAPALAKTSPDEAIRAAARTLVERTQPDPIAVKLVLLAGALLVVLAGWWIVHAKPPPGASPATTTPVERVTH